MIIIFRLRHEVEAALVALPQTVAALSTAVDKLTEAVLSGESEELATLKDQLAQSTTALAAAVAAAGPSQSSNP